MLIKFCQLAYQLMVVKLV